MEHVIPLETRRLIKWAEQPENPGLPLQFDLPEAFHYSSIGQEGDFYKGGGVREPVVKGAREELVRRLSYAIELLPEKDKLAGLSKALVGKDPFEVGREVRSLKAYVETHPGDALQHPILGYVAELPTDFLPEALLAYQRLSDADKGKSITKKWEKGFGGKRPELDLDLFEWKPSSEGKFELLMSIGRLHPSELYKGFIKKKTSPKEYAGILEAYRIAEKMYGAEWEKACPEKQDRVRAILADIEWQYDNPLLTSTEDQKNVKKLNRWSPLLTHLARDNEEGSDGDFSWKYLLKQLWENESEFKQQFFELPYSRRGTIDEGEYQPPPNAHLDKLVSIDDPRYYIDDPRFGLTLYEIGTHLMAWDPVFEDPRERTPEKIQALAKKMIKELGVPGDDRHGSDIHEIYVRGVRSIQWQDLEAVRVSLEQALDQKGNLDQVASMLPGPHRDILMYEYWKRDPQNERQPATWYLERLQEKIPDSAKANRAADIMNDYVRSHFVEGTMHHVGFAERVTQDYYREQGIDPGTIPAQRPLIPDLNGKLLKAHVARKERAQKKWNDTDTPGVNDLYLFSDTYQKNPRGTTYGEVAYRARAVAEYGQQMLEDPQASDADVIEKFVMRWLPEACQLRDFFLENAVHLRIWEFLQRSSLKDQLDSFDIQYTKKKMNLHHHFDGRDDGVLSGAYMTEYTLHRVEGFVTHVGKLQEQERRELEGILRKVAAQSTPATMEKYERLAINLEYPLLRKAYDEMIEDGTPQEQAFEHVLQRIRQSFPNASYYRDGLLESIGLNVARTPEQGRKVEHMTYGYLMRNPGVEKKEGDQLVFSPVETVRNYLAAFKDREARGRILSWIFGGELPDDRFLEGDTFHVNADVEKEAFWIMSHEEQKTVLYHALLGEHGLFDCTSKPKAEQVYGEKDPFQAMEVFLESFYTHNFQNLLEKDASDGTTERSLKAIFFETFGAYAPARRVELLCGITKKMKEVRESQASLTGGQAIRLFLEQIGAVGVKIGQVLSEHADLVPEPIGKELSSLRDRAAPFSKFGVFTYLRMAKIFGEQGATSTFHVLDVGECVGSASIKQVHEGTTNTNKAIVIKVPRPSIDKYFEEDARVLTRVMTRLRAEGSDVPEYLMPEIIDACRGEFDFGKDAAAQQELQHIFEERQATMQVDGKKFSVCTPHIEHVIRKGETAIKNLQLIVEERIFGLSLSDIDGYQKGSPQEKEDIESRLHRMYGKEAPRVLYEYQRVDTSQIRAQCALEIVQQITHDGIFQADPHSGNIIVDLQPGKERVVWIDFGSVGRSLEKENDGSIQKDHRQAFGEFIQSLFMLWTMKDTGTLGKIISTYVEQTEIHAENWSERVADIYANHSEPSEFFKELMSAILSSKGKVHQSFKMLLKALAAGGGHFDALARNLKGAG